MYIFKFINQKAENSSCKLKNVIVSDGTKMTEKETEREGRRKTITEEEWGKKIRGVNDSLMKRQADERGGRGGVEDKMLGCRKRQRETMQGEINTAG